MNKDQLKKIVGCHAILVPPACRLDQNDRELPAIDDDRWIVEAVTEEGVTISRPRSGHTKMLNYDHIHHFTSDAAKNGAMRGFLTLLVQLTVQGNEVRIYPTRPGEPVPHKTPEVIEVCVDFKYPLDSGIQQKWEAAGYAVAWCSETRLRRQLDLEGWERVVEPDGSGRRVAFRLKDRPSDQILIKRAGGRG
jgi:hypothetical protein